MISLYDDQRELVERVRAAMRTHKSVLLQSPTGSGKSRMGASIAQSALMRGKSVGFNVPMKELRKQISNDFTEHGLDHSFVASGFKYNPFAQCFVTTTGTLSRRLETAPKLDLLLLDETHNGGDGLNRVIEHYKAQGAYIIGLSATPERLDGKGLDLWYDEMIMGQSIKYLIEQGRLSDYDLYAPSKPDLSALRMSGTDYRKEDVAGFMESNSVLIGDAVKHYKQLAMGRRNVTYCASIKHSKMTCQMFNDAGIPSAHIDGEMNDEERTKIIKAFARREILNITNADLLLYGFDLAAASGDRKAVIETISDLKPTMSKAMQFQKNGRALRAKPDGSRAVIMDHASNAFNPDGSVKHGLPCAEQQWQWRGREKKRGGEAEKTIPVRQCPTCFMCHRPTPQCPACGHVYEINSRVLEQVDGELLHIDKDALRDVKKAERQLQGRAESLADLVALGKRKGYSNPHAWARKVMEGRSKKV